MNPFPILPWEHPGTDFHPAPHALASLEVGGRTREFGLKMRQGVLFFKEANRLDTWAVSRLLPMELAGDEAALVEAWRGEVARDNFGRFVTRHFVFSRTPAHGLATMIHRADGSSWIKEWFDDVWLETPPFRVQKRFDVWGTKFQTASLRAIKSAMPKMLNRTLAPLDQISLPLRWLKGSEEELRRVFSLAVRLFARARRSETEAAVRFSAFSPAGTGGFEHRFDTYDFQRDLRTAPAFASLLGLVEQHCLPVGLSWFEPTEDVFRASVADKPFVAEQNQKWGEMWRGHFDFRAPSVELRAPVPLELSAHETFEARLGLRDWLSDKVSKAQNDSFLKRALN